MAAQKLRITGGTARGVPLFEPRGTRLRPTSALVREAIFNLLATRISGARVLDLYAGTGALGIEALSRGAAHVTFVESEQGAIHAIMQSLPRTGFSEHATVIRGRLPAALRSIHEHFDIVFLDPPYRDPGAEETLREALNYARADGIVVYEHGSRYNPPERLGDFRLSQRRTYGDSALALYVRQEGE